MGMIQAPNQTPADRLDQMVQQYEKDLLRICCIYLRDRTAAEDVVQETFLKAYRSLKTFRYDANEKNWLSRIAINCCRDLSRSSWFRDTDRSVTLDMLPEPKVQPSYDDDTLTIEIMRLREVILGLHLRQTRVEMYLLCSFT